MLWLRNSWTPSTGSLLERILARRAERSSEVFVCGVRVISGEVTGETTRWQVRPSAVDPLWSGETFTLYHGGDVTLRMILSHAGQRDRGARPGHLVVAAWLPEADAAVQLSVDTAGLARFEPPRPADHPRRG